MQRSLSISSAQRLFLLLQAKHLLLFKPNTFFASRAPFLQRSLLLLQAKHLLLCNKGQSHSSAALASLFRHLVGSRKGRHPRDLPVPAAHKAGEVYHPRHQNRRRPHQSAGRARQLETTMPMNIAYPQCLSVGPVLTTIMAVSNTKCYPANGPRAELNIPTTAQNVSFVPPTKSPYFNEEMLVQGTTPTLGTVYINANSPSTSIVADIEGQTFTSLQGIHTFDTITVTAQNVQFNHVHARQFVWNTAGPSSACTDCGTIDILPKTGQRFFKCTGSPTFTHVTANVLAPACKCNFVDATVTILRDRSSPDQTYTNSKVTDLTVRTPSHKVEFASKPIP